MNLHTLYLVAVCSLLLGICSCNRPAQRQEAGKTAVSQQPQDSGKTLVSQQLQDSGKTQVSQQPQETVKRQESEQQQEPDKTPESEQQQEIRPAPEPVRENAAESQSGTSTANDSVVFRVQIISSLYENSFPTVIIEGRSYETYQYFYMGSYRITVGKFDSLKEANEFKIKCLNSGFKQAFVAAFRGDKRVTDPSVYKQ